MSLPWPNLTTEQWRERLAHVRRDFRPDEPRDENGRWTSGGASSSSSSSGTKYPSVVDGEEQLVKSHDEIRAFAEEQGFPADRVDVGKATAAAKKDIADMGLNPNRVVGYYDPETKRLFINEKGLGSMDRERARGMVAHEVAHSRFADALNGSAQGDVEKFVLDNKLKLFNDGHVSEYAKAWWSRVNDPPTSFNRASSFATAVDESLAEYTRLKAFDKSSTYAQLDKIVRRSAKV